MGILQPKRLPIGLVNRIPVSFNQEFLCMLDLGDDEGPFGPRHIIAGGWRIGGRIDSEVLHDALDELVVRHEALRTTIVRDDVQRYQQVLPPTTTELVEIDLSDEVTEFQRQQRIEELLIEIESGSYHVVHPPLLMAVLGRFTADDSVLVLVAHRTAADQWSLRLLIQDLAWAYAGRRGFAVPEQAPATQYGEYAIWERAHAAGAAARRDRTYWRAALAGASMTALPTDHPRSSDPPRNTSVYRFPIDRELTAATLALAAATSSSPFMVLLAAFEIFLHERTGATDTVVPALTSGRGDARFYDTIGSFFNFVALRTDLAGCATFRELVYRTRRTCRDAYAHDIPFALVLREVPELGMPFAADDLAVVGFEVFELPALLDREPVGDLEFSDVRRRRMSQSESTEIPDGALFQLEIDPTGETVGALAFDSNLYEVDTIVDMATHFHAVLTRTVGTPDAPLSSDTAPPS